MLSDGTTLLDSSGNLELDPTGLERQTDGLADDCCCPGMTPPCDICPPTFQTLLSLNIPCVNCGDGTSYGLVDPARLGIAFCLRFISTVGTVCTWQGQVATTCPLIQHCDSADCGGTCVDAGGGITATLTIDGTGAELTIWVGGFEVFHGTATVTDCTDNPIVIGADARTPGCVGLIPNFNNGGSVTLIPGDCPTPVTSTCADPQMCFVCGGLGTSPTQYRVAISAMILDQSCEFTFCGGALRADDTGPGSMNFIATGFCTAWVWSGTGPSYSSYFPDDDAFPTVSTCIRLNWSHNGYSATINTETCGDDILYTLKIYNEDFFSVFNGSAWASSCNEIITIVNRIQSRNCDTGDEITITEASRVFGGVAVLTPC